MKIHNVTYHKQVRKRIAGDEIDHRLGSPRCYCFSCVKLISNLMYNQFLIVRRQQEIEAAGLENPALMSELRALRQRKDELETHLATLQDSRRQLMVQLEGLMKMLKV